MSAKPGIILIAVATLLLVFGINVHEELPAILAVFFGGAGIATLIAAASGRPRELPPPSSDLIESRFQQLEKRLQVTEDELAAASREIASLRETRDFDRQLLHGRRPGIPPATKDRPDST